MSVFFRSSGLELLFVECNCLSHIHKKKDDYWQKGKKTFDNMNDNRIGALVVKETQLTGSIILSIFYQNKWFFLDENEIHKFTARGALNFFQVGVCGLDFQNVGLANWYLPLKWRLVNQKFPNLRGCELKISKFGGLWAKIWVKIEAVEAKISKFCQKGSCELTLLLEMGPLRTTGEAWKGRLQGRTSPYPLSRSVLPLGLQCSGMEDGLYELTN